MFTSKNYSFDNLKERVQNAQQGLSVGWKNIADKAKKEVKIVNKIARKALATEDGGKLRDGYVVTVDLDAGFDIFKGFQDNWVSLHKNSVTNVNKAEQVDVHLHNFTREWQKYESYLEEFQGNLIVLPEVISKVEIIQKRIDSIGTQTQKIEDLLLEYEDACERYELEKCKVDMRVKLSELVETKQAEYTLKKSVVNNTEDSTIIKEMSMKKIARFSTGKVGEISASAEKQKAYEDAFLDQMNQYIQYGEIEKPIAGTLAEHETISVADINIDDSDLSTLREFLGPEEMNSVIQAQESQSKSSKKTDTETVNTNTSTTTTEDSKESLNKANSNIDVNVQRTEENKESSNKTNSNIDIDVKHTEESDATDDKKLHEEVDDKCSATADVDSLEENIVEEDNEILSSVESSIDIPLKDDVDISSAVGSEQSLHQQISCSDDENEFYDAPSANIE